MGIEATPDGGSPQPDAAAIGRVPSSVGEGQPFAEKADPPRSNAAFVSAVLAPTLLFFVLPPLSKCGLWDPYEVTFADLSRRLAVNLMGARTLWLDNADNSMPHLNTLGRPELPFESVALGFKVFGLHDWAGRLPLAVWGLLGVLATFGFVARLVDARAGVFASLALCSMPLYLVQSRTMLGDIVVMAAFAMSFGGLAVAVFDCDAKGPRSVWRRIPWLLLGIAGLAGGFGSRGGIIGLAVPMLGVGIAWGVTWAAGARRIELFGDAIGALALIGGLAVLAKGLSIFSADDGKDLSMWVGAMVKPQPKYHTFDYVIGHLGPALAPWSAFVPFALGRLFHSPMGRSGWLFQRESFARVAIVVAASVAVFAHGWLAPRTELIAFCAPSVLAAACGIAIRDFERGAPASVATGVGTAVLLGIFHHDFHELPERAFQAFAVVGASFPENFKGIALQIWTVVLVGFAIVAFFTWAESDVRLSGSSRRRAFDPTHYVSVLNSLRVAWDGYLALAYFATVAGSSLAGLAIWTGVRTHAKWLPTMSLQVRDILLNAWWVSALVPLGVIMGMVFVSDAWLWAFGGPRSLSRSSFTRGFQPFEDLWGQLRSGARTRGPGWFAALFVVTPFLVIAIPGVVILYLMTHGSRPIVAVAFGLPSGVALFLMLGLVGDVLGGSRAAFLPLVGALSGIVLSMGYYPALANQLSPKEVFDSYRRFRKDGEPLGLLGIGDRTSAYYAGGQPPTFRDPPEAFKWLVEGADAQRRYLIIKTDELGRLNHLYRKSLPEDRRANVPVLDARSSQLVLIASSLTAGERNQNPLDKFVLSSKPTPQHALSVNLDDKLDLFGYDVADQSGRLVDSVAAGRKYRMRSYYRVLEGPITTEWQAFIHIDGRGRRHNGDHKPLEGKYPFSLWLAGDFIVDDYEFELEPNFGAGTYTLYFGLYFGCDGPECRLKVKSGPQDGVHRVVGGQLRVQ
jgi:hypothetical protein